MYLYKWYYIIYIYVYVLHQQDDVGMVCLRKSVIPM